MRQITDKNGNVLAEPYLTMANENFNPNFSSLFGEYMSIDYAFDWSKSSRGKLFWEAVYQGLLPVISVILPELQLTVQAATAARVALEARMTNDAKYVEYKHKAKVQLINVGRDAEGGPEITIKAMI